MNWAQRLKRVFPIDIERCEQSGGKGKLIASIEYWVTEKRHPRGPPVH